MFTARLTPGGLFKYDPPDKRITAWTLPMRYGGLSEHGIGLIL